MGSAFAVLLLAASLPAFAQDPHAGETSRERDARMKWWREARFGMFIHWGLYAEPAGVWKGRRSEGAGEWIMHDLKIPVDDYATLVPGFNPVEFDADRWVAVAKAAGMRYIVMTAKHHEGFAMFRSADPYSISATPFPRDPLAEMAAACKKAGLKFGVYYSQAQDWHHAGGAAYGGHWDPKQDGDLHAYVRDVAAPQARELMAYKPAVLWWDTPVDMTKADLDALTAALPKSIIMNDRLGNGVAGDTETLEQTIPTKGFPGRDWETCMTINDTWGYKADDTEFKSSATLLRNLIDIASKGGNYLLNVGPDARGVIPAPEVGRLGDMGAWMRKNGRSIYATTVSPYRRLPFEGRATLRGDSLFLNVFDWPTGGVELNGLKTPVREVRLLATNAKLPYTFTGGHLVVPKPSIVDPSSTAIEIRLAGPPVVDEPEATVAANAPGDDVLRAEDADLTGALRIEHTPPNVGYWTDPDSVVSWRISGPSGNCRLACEYACPADTAGSQFAVEIDGRSADVIGTVAPTGG